MRLPKNVRTMSHDEHRWPAANPFHGQRCASSRLTIQVTPAILFAFYAVIVIVSGLYYCATPPSPDQSDFDYIAWQGLHGMQWYKDSFDITWPGALFLHEVGIRLFGVHRWTARLNDLLLLQPAIIGMFYFLKTAGLGRAAVACALTYPLIYMTSGDWIAGHRDIVAMHLLIAASAILVSTCYHEGLRLFVTGLILGFAVMLRPTYLAFAPALLIAAMMIPQPRLVIPRILRGGCLLVLGTMICPSIFALAGVLTGTFNDWLADGVLFVFNAYQVTEPRSRLVPRFFALISELWIWLAVTGAAGMTFWVATRKLRVHTMLLVGMVATVLISYTVQNKGFGYHLSGLIPLFLLSAVGGAELGISTAPLRPAAVRIGSLVLALTILLVLAAGLTRRVQHNLVPQLSRIAHSGLSMAIAVPDDRSEKEAFRREVISIITTESRPDERFFQWGWNFDVGFRSQRLSGSRYLHTPLFALIDGRDPRYQQWLHNFDRDLMGNRPAFILLDLTLLPHETSFNKLPIVLPADASPGLALLVAHINRDYSLRRAWADAFLFKRN